MKCAIGSLVLLSMVAGDPAWSQVPADPRNLVVMMKFRDGTGAVSNGAGIIIDQNEQRTLIATAGHNLRDELSELHTNFEVFFYTDPGRGFSAQAVPDIISDYDFGLVIVDAQNTPDILGAGRAADVIGLDSILSDSEKVFVVGYGGGLAWKHGLMPDPVRRISVAELQIESNAQLPGQSGGGVFNQDWSLIGMIYEVEANMAKALPISVVLDEVRNSKFSVGLQADPLAMQKRARRNLADRRIDWSSSAIADALSTADIEVLELFSRANVELEKITEALGMTSSRGSSVARAFFDRSNGNNEAIRWLNGELRRGLDANATVKGDYYESEGLLILAVRAGNAAAVKALVEGGASPHAFQDIWFTYYSILRFLSPSYSVYVSDAFSLEEKQELLRLYSEHDVVIPGIEGFGGDAMYQMKPFYEVLTNTRNLPGIDVMPSPTMCEKPRTSICETATERSGIDWCSISESLPKRVYLEPGGRSYHFYDLHIIGFLNSEAGKGYFLGVEQLGHFKGPVLVEVSQDGTAWQLYMYMSPQAAMGHCRKDENDYVRENCWRRISMTLDRRNDRMMVENYYPYKISAQCSY
ncbi:MAG: serine protease [Gammaproteobacteria bacterium]|nr:serine protease [Gammaproteobacteria bacterium]NNL50202.1 trypsin-like peptidase domain-containing protein [Woeseiaceae bacterium]